MKVIKNEENQIVLPEKEGYVAVERYVSPVKLNLIPFLWGFPIFVGCVLSHVLIWKGDFIPDFSLRTILFLGCVFLVALLPLMFLFELLHGVAWCWMSRIPLGRMRFGFAGEGLLFQCRIDGKLMKKKHYVRGLVWPDIMLLLVLLFFGLLTNCFVATMLATVIGNCLICDVMVVNNISGENGDMLVYVHPKQAGVFLYQKEEQPSAEE